MDNAKAPLVKSTKKSSKKPVITHKSARALPSNATRAASPKSSFLNSVEGRGPPCPPGLSGLENLGNTCFVNSIIQCLSNCGPITKHFQEARQTGRANDFEGSGSLAKTFADIIAMIWSGKHTTTVPQQFQIELSRVAPQFSGYQQRDAQELLTFLLDGLHLDLNFFSEENEEEKYDIIHILKALDEIIQEDNSVVVDNFQGVLRSSVSCSECEKASTKYEIFNTLSLPIPLIERTVQVRWIPQIHPPTEVTVQTGVPRTGTVRDLVMGVGKIIAIEPELLVLYGANVNHCLHFFALDEPMENLDDKYRLYVCDLPEDVAKDPYCNYEIAERFMKANDHLGFFSMVYESERSTMNPQVLPIPRQIHLGYFPNRSKREHFVSLEECLDLFVAKENLEGNNAWYCPHCSKFQDASKKLDLWKLPNILVFHLKRFAYSEARIDKLGATVLYPMYGLNIDHLVASETTCNAIYDLVGVCNHYGTLMEGHYTSYCKNYRDGNWYCYDDATVTKVSPKLVQDREPQKDKQCIIL